MCDYCTATATDLLLDAVNLGYSLPLATRLVRDLAISRGLMDRIATQSIEDVQKLYDIVTEASEDLTALQATIPEAFTMLCRQRQADREES